MKTVNYKEACGLMKKIIAFGITCIFLCLFSSCTTYKNITFIENDGEEYLLYQDKKYYETPIFNVTKNYGIENENDTELGWYYSCPFSTRFYSENLESPIFIYTIGSDTSVYLREDYEYSTDTFVVEETCAEIIWKDIFSSEKNDVQFSNPIAVTLYSKQYPRIKTSLVLSFVDEKWYIRYSDSQEIWIPSDEFLKILSDNGII